MFKHNMLIHGNQQSEKDCLPSQTAHNSSVFHCTGRHPSPRRFRHTGPDFIKTPASQGETKQVLKCAASCSDPLWNSMSFNSKDAIFYSEFQERILFSPLLCKECHTMSKLHRLKSFVFGTLDISNVISVAVVWLICSRTTCLLFYSKSNLYHLVNTAISLTKESLPAPLCRTLVLLWFWRTSDHNPHNSNNRRRTISSSATLLFHVFTLEVFLKASNQYSSCWKAVNLK